MKYDQNNLVVHAHPRADGLITRVTPAMAGWDYITFEVRELTAGQSHAQQTGANEVGIVVLSGTVSVQSDRGTWSHIGKRQSVFEGKPYAIYLSRNSHFTITADSDAEIALGWCPTDEDHPAKLIEPKDIAIEVRGGDNATRHINNMLPPGFPCQRLVVVEVYTPGGSWSSYPPHKHDIHKTDAQGNVVEADLEEVYYYKFDRPEGYAFQRVYTAPESPLHATGQPIDAVVLARQDDAVLIPEGYHPVAAAPGYTAYYLNVLAGSAQSLANSDDPVYSWVKSSYHGRDPRVPMYDVSRAREVR